MAKPTKQDVVNELYAKKYKQLKLAPAHVTGLKKSMLAAAKKRGAGTKELNAAAKAFMSEKGIKAKGKSTKKGKETTKQERGKKKTKEKKQEKGSRDGSVKRLREEHHLTQMGEESLKDLAKEREVKVKKSHSADTIRENINKDLIDLQKGTLHALAGVDLSKVKDCIGLFIDFRDASCIKCSSQKDCLKKFSKHQKNGFKAFSGLRIGIEVQEKAEKVDTELVSQEEEKKKTSGYDLDRKIDVFNEPLDKKDDLYDVARVVKKKVPATIGALQTIILSMYKPQEDTDESRAQLTKEFIDIFVEWDLIELL